MLQNTSTKNFVPTALIPRPSIILHVKIPKKLREP